MKDPMTDLKSARSATLFYTIDTERNHVRLDKPQDVAALVDALRVIGTKEGVQVGLVPFGGVDFELADGSVANVIFVKDEQLDVGHFGQLYVDRAFYEKACALASAHAGRTIDVLQMN